MAAATIRSGYGCGDGTEKEKEAAHHPWGEEHKPADRNERGGELVVGAHDSLITCCSSVDAGGSSAARHGSDDRRPRYRAAEDSGRCAGHDSRALKRLDAGKQCDGQKDAHPLAEKLVALKYQGKQS